MKPEMPDRERRAYWCERCEPPLRVFLRPGEPIPRCSRHGKLRRQQNKPYKRT